MRAIAGYIHLDGSDPPKRIAECLAARACPDPDAQARHAMLALPGGVLVASEWGPTDSRPAAALFRDPASGCSVIADARLEQLAALAARLGLKPYAMPTSPAAWIAAAWLRWGEACADELRGDFAFAIHDPRSASVYVARDIMGVRPMYFHHQQGRLLAFASRAMALPGLAGIPDALDRGRIADALVTELEGVDKTSTFFRAVQRLPPAHCARVTRGGMRGSQYWAPAAGRVAVPRGAAAWTDAFVGALETAVAEHLVGDGRVGCMLSGGLDSSSLAAVAAAQLAAAGRAPLATFSSIDGDPAEAETRAIRAMLTLPGLQPRLLDDQQLVRLRDPVLTALRHGDEPFDGSMGLLHLQYRAAHDAGIEALMDGIDGDTLLSEGSTLLRQVRGFHWRSAWRNVRGLQRIYPAMSAPRYIAALARSAFIPARIHRALRRAPPHRELDAALSRSLIAPQFAHEIDLRGRLARLADWSSQRQQFDTTRQAAIALANPYTTSGLERYHRVAAWHGIEPRHPLLNRDLLDLCVNLPDAQRIDRGWTKAVLRQAMNGRLPDAVCWRQGKEHLGFRVTQRLQLVDPAAITRELARLRDRLLPFVDVGRMDTMLASDWHGKCFSTTAARILELLWLGRWLKHAAAPGRNDAKPCALTRFQ